MKSELSEQQFEALWERAALHSSLSQMSSEYRVWCKRRVRRRNILACAAGLCIFTVVAYKYFAMTDSRYDAIACNRSGYSGDYWVDVVNEMLVSEV